MQCLAQVSRCQRAAVPGPKQGGEFAARDPAAPQGEQRQQLAASLARERSPHAFVLDMRAAKQVQIGGHLRIA